MYTMKSVKKEDVLNIINELRTLDKDIYWLGCLDSFEDNINNIKGDNVYTNYVIIACLETRTLSVDIARKNAMDELFERFNEFIKDPVEY